MNRIFDTFVLTFGMVLMFALVLCPSPVHHPQWFIEAVVCVGVISGFAAVARWNWGD